MIFATTMLVTENNPGFLDNLILALFKITLLIASKPQYGIKNILFVL